jgi:hypothetical protein
MRVGNNELNRRHLRPGSLLLDIVRVMLLRYDCYYDQIENRAVCALPGWATSCKRKAQSSTQLECTRY